MMPVIVLTPPRWSRSPLQVFLLCLCVITGILITANISRNPVTREMGEPWATVWGLSLCVGASVALTGSFWKNKITGMLIERSGILLLGAVSLIWPILVIYVTGFNGLFSSVATLFFSISCFFQVRYINKHINLILEAINHGGHVIE